MRRTTSKAPKIETLFKNHEDSTFKNHEENCIDNISITIYKNRRCREHYTKRKKTKQAAKQLIGVSIINNSLKKNSSNLSKRSSMLEFENNFKKVKLKNSSSDAILNKSHNPFNSKFVVNVVSKYQQPEGLNAFNNPLAQVKWRVYRCQLSTQDESCCCSCNSDAMFEVMKSLYDCYKKKNCDHCNCILCGHLPREERKLGEQRKSVASGVLTVKQKVEKEKKKELTKKAEKEMVGKSEAEKEKILKQLAKSGAPLPEGKTASEKELIKKVKTAVGLPQGQTAADEEKIRMAEAAGMLTPLEGKSKAQKEKILKHQAQAGLPLPEGRTASEKALIAKVKAETVRAPSKAVSAVAVPSEKIRKAKAAGFMTPLEGKTPEQQQKIIRGLAMSGVPLPEGKTASEKKLIDKVRTEVGLPPEPKSATEKKKYEKALAAGIITPLEGKSKAQKEKILKSQAEAGLPLPEGRTASEKALVAKVKAETVKTPSKAVSAVAVPSEKIRKAKAAGFMTPLEGKTPEQQQKIIRGLAMSGVPLPEGKTSSEKKLIDKVRTEVGLPPEPKSATEKKKYEKALAAGIITPLEGKSKAQKEKILKSQAEAGLPLPEGRTASEKALVAKVKAETVRAPSKAVSAVGVPSEKIRKAKAAGFMTPLEGKTPEQQQKIIRGLAMSGVPLPEGKTASEKKLIDKVRTEVGLPPEPKSATEKKKYEKALAAGIITPLEGKSKSQKEKILKSQAEAGLPLPEGRTASEKVLIAKIKASTKPPAEGTPSLSEKLRKAKAAGLTPLEGKPQQAEVGEKKTKAKAIGAGRPALPPEKAKKLDEKTAKIMKEGKGPSDECICGLLTPESERVSIAKVAAAKTPSERLKAAKATGLLTPLTGKSPEEREKILTGLAKQGVMLPEGKTASEKKIIEKVRTELGMPPEPKTAAMKEKYAKSLAQGIMTPLEGKTVAQKEKILKAQAEAGIPLPEGRTASEKALISKVKATVGAPSVGKIPSEKLRKAKAAGLLTPLSGKTPEQKENILKGLAKQGLPLPEGKTASENKIIEKVRTELGMPPEPKTAAMKEKYAKSLAQGIMTPLEGKTVAQKEKILKAQAEAGVPLPEGRTASEKALISKVKATVGAPSVGKIPSEKLRKAKAAGLLTPLSGKPPEQKEKILKGLAKHGLPLPDGKTPSEKKLVEKVRVDLGLPSEPKTPSMKEKYTKAQAQGIMTPLEGKTVAQKENILKAQAEAGIPLPEGRTASEKALISKVKATVGAPPKKGPPAPLSKAKAIGAGRPALPPEKAKKLDEKTAKIMKEGKGPSDECICGLLTPESDRVSIAKAAALKTPSERLKAAKATGLLTPLTGKSPEEREKILTGLAKQGVMLPEGKTASEKKIIEKVRTELGMPPEPKTAAMKEKYAKSLAQGIITPLEGKTVAQKEKIIKAQAEAGIPLPEGRTASEKALISKVKATVGAPSVGKIPSEKLRKAKAAGLLTPLSGKPPEQKEKILKGLAKHGLPLPDGKTPSEKKLVEKVRVDLGLPSEPKTPSMKEKYTKAQAQGIMTPLEGKTVAQKEKIIKAQAEAGIPLPEGRTASEKALISKVKATVGAPSVGKIPSEKLRKAKAAGLLTPLSGKPPEQKEKILKGLAKQGLPLPEGKTASEKKIVEKVRTELGMPPEPKTAAMKEKYAKSLAQGIMTPLEGKTVAQKEKILKAQAEAGIPLPEGRTASEKALISKVKATVGAPSVGKIPSEKLRKAKAAGLLTPLSGKTPEQKENILKGLAKQGLPLPEGKTASEKKIIEKVRTELGMPPEPKTAAMKEKYAKSLAQGIMTPLEGKTVAQKEKILKAQAEAGIPLPEGRTASEKALISKVKATVGAPSKKGPPVPLSKEAKALEQKTAKVMKEGKGPSDECICGILTPESEKFVAKPSKPSVGKVADKIPSEKLRKAKAAGLLTPLKGKSAAQKEKILKGLAETGMPLPEGKTASEKAMVQKVKTEFGIPKAVTPSEKEIVRKAKAEGLLTPLAGKTAAQKEKIIKGLVETGLPLPEAKTASEKQMIQKARAAAGLSAEATASEKLGKIKTKSKKVGAAASKRIARGIGGTGVSKAGIVEEFEDVLKTTTCDRGCGCDKKKIRFKHSYVKIRVTSPDISSLCPCPDECVPGVKGGVFVDNEGIKVTVGSAVGFPKFSIGNENKISSNSCNLAQSFETNPSLEEPNPILEIYNANDFKFKYKNKDIKVNYSNDSLSTSEEQNYIYTENLLHNYRVNEIETKSDIRTRASSSRYLIACSESVTSDSDFLSSCKSSLSSLIVVKTESSLSFSTKSNTSIRAISIISFHNSSIISTSSHYLCFECSQSDNCISAKDSEYFTNIINYSAINSIASESEGIKKVPVDKVISAITFQKSRVAKNDPCVFRISQTNLCYNKKYTSKNVKYSHRYDYYKKHSPIVVINELNNKQDLRMMIDEILAKKDIANASSIFVVVPTSDDDTDLSETASSTICIRISENFFNWKKSLGKVNNPQTYSKTDPLPRGLTICAKGKQFLLESTPTSFKVKDKYHQPTETLFERTTQNKDIQVNNIVESPDACGRKELHGVNMDTTQDRPCCCTPTEQDSGSLDNYGSYDRCVANVYSELITPMIINQSNAQGLSQEAYRNIPRLNLNDYKSVLMDQTTSVAMCEVPLCSPSYPDCHLPNAMPQQAIGQEHTMGTQYPPNLNLSGLQKISAISPPCRCCAGNTQATKTQPSPRSFQSVGCGPTACKQNSAASFLRSQGDNPCSSCGRPTTKDGRKISCLCKGKEKKIQFPSECPCEQHKPSTESKAIRSKSLKTRTVGGQSCLCDGKKLDAKEKKKKNIICECPQMEEEEEPINDIFEMSNSFVDQTVNRKMRSDLTQTTSGFKFNFKKRPPLVEEMSFEDALKYFEEHPDEGDATQVDECCLCDENSGVSLPADNPDVNCQCPFEPTTDELTPEVTEEPVKGLKLHIGGKGSGSKGLSGICCFDMLQESNGLLLLYDY